MLEAYGISTLAEAVELASGMSLVRTTFYRDLPTARGVLQEHYANRILLLINGLPTWMASTGGFTLARIDIADVERIEILKGPASVLYGSNGFSGAINVILRRPKASQGQLQVGYGDGGGHRAGLKGQVLGRSWDVFASANGFKVQGGDLQTPGEAGATLRSREYLRARTANLVFHWGAHSVQANVFEADWPHLGNLVRPSGGAGQPYTMAGHLLGYQYKQRLGEAFRVHYAVSLDQYRIQYATSQDGTNARRAQAHRLTHRISTLWDPMAWLSLEGGFTSDERISDEFQTYNPGNGQVLDENRLRAVKDHEGSAFFQAHLFQGRWQLLAGSRYTENGNFGPNLSSRVTANYQVSPTSTLKAIWGQSYRAPNMLEQYTQVPGALYGRRDLRPETFDSFELGYVGHLESWVLQVLAYRGVLRNKVVRLPRYPRLVSTPLDTSSSFENGAPYKVHGLEVELRYEHSQGLQGFLNADFQGGSNGDQVPGIPGYNNHFAPDFHLRAGLSKHWGAWTLAGHVQHQAATGGPLAPIPSWTSVNLSLRWLQGLPGTTLRHALTLGNTLDQERWHPEYVRRVVNRIPDGMGRQASYTLAIGF
jgi:outer membrane receptor protein involved in Fe transport